MPASQSADRQSSRGRVLGGSSSINGMIYMRGQSANYDGWRQAGNVGWGWDWASPAEPS
jgi:choline dehydrogenase-like flavoprotein